MLAPEEITVGALGNANPLSLMFPRNNYEERILVGQVDGVPSALFLSGQHRFKCFRSVGNPHWRGLIIAGVRIEVDETSLFDPDSDAPLGAAIRTGRRLIARGKSEDHYGSTTAIVLHDELPDAGDLRAGFMRWRLVVGSSHEKRVLIEIDVAPKTQA